MHRALEIGEANVIPYISIGEFWHLQKAEKWYSKIEIP